MKTTTTPTAANRVAPATKEDDYKADLLAMVVNTCNAAREAQKLDADATTAEQHCVTVDDLKHGSPGERHLRSFLMTLSRQGMRAIEALADLGQQRRITCSYWQKIEQHFGRRRSDADVLATLLEAQPSLAENLRRGYGWARRHGALEKVSASLDESGAALRAIEEEEFHDEVIGLSYARSDVGAREP